MHHYKLRSLSGTFLVSGLFLGLCYVMLRYVPGDEDANQGAFSISGDVFVGKSEESDDGVREPFSTYSIALQMPEDLDEEEELSGLDLLLSGGFDTAFSTKPSSRGETQADEDTALSLYRKPLSRPAVEWFYTHVTGSREVARVVLENADKNDIPPSLAFALAYVESRYKPKAVNRNKNGSIDRGLFQLNNATFKKLSEEQFFDPEVSAKFGMTHLRYCLDAAGDEITALAMYNAGAVRVRNNGTPQHTLNYVAQISKYRKSLDRQFAAEVASFYAEQPGAEKMLAMAK